jgi:hypothetical protein
VDRTNAAQTGANIWNTMILVDEGGKIARRHSAYFVFDDGSQGGRAYLSSTPVRMIMEFDGVNTSATSATLSVGQDRVQNVPITAQQNATAGAAPAKTESKGGAQKPVSQAKPQ